MKTFLVLFTLVPLVSNLPQKYGVKQRRTALSSVQGYSQAEISMGSSIANKLDSLFSGTGSLGGSGSGSGYISGPGVLTGSGSIGGSGSLSGYPAGSGSSSGSFGGSGSSSGSFGGSGSSSGSFGGSGSSSGSSGGSGSSSGSFGGSGSSSGSFGGPGSSTGSFGGSGSSSGSFGGFGSFGGGSGGLGGISVNPGTGSLQGCINTLPKNNAHNSKLYLDVVIVLDSSGSVGSASFDDAKTAAKAVVKFINMKGEVKATGSRIGLIEFSSTGLTNVAFHVGSYNILWDYLDAIDRVTYDSGPATATAQALREAYQEFCRYGIPQNPKLVWIITDGNSNDGGNPIPVASLLKDQGVEVCATGVGSSINPAEINGIASSGCAYYPTSFSSYIKAMEVAVAKGSGTFDASKFFSNITAGNQFGK